MPHFSIHGEKQEEEGGRRMRRGRGGRRIRRGRGGGRRRGGEE
jgi:hypothetical protein